MRKDGTKAARFAVVAGLGLALAVGGIQSAPASASPGVAAVPDAAASTEAGNPIAEAIGMMARALRAAGDGIADAVGGEATRETPAAVTGTVTALAGQVPTGGTVRLDVRYAFAEDVRDAKVTLKVAGPRGMTLKPSDGGVAEGDSVTWAVGDAREGTLSVDVTVPDAAEAAGRVVTAEAEASAEGVGATPLDASGVSVKVAENAVEGSLKASAASVATGGTFELVASAACKGGHATDVATTVRVRGVPDSAISAEGATVRDGVVTFPAASAGKGEALPDRVVRVTVPNDMTFAAGGRVTATASVSGPGVPEAAIGEASVDVLPNKVTGGVRAASATVETGGEMAFDVDVTCDSGSAADAVVTLEVDGASGSEIEAPGGEVSGSTVTFPAVTADGPGPLPTRRIVVRTPDDASAAGRHVTVSGKVAGSNFEPVTLAPATSVAESPTLAGDVTLSDRTPSAGDEIRATVTPRADGGTAHGVTVTVAVADAPGAVVTCNGREYGNVVTVPVGDLAGDAAPIEVGIRLPNDASLNGRTVTVTAEATARNAPKASLGSASAEVQTPVVTLKATASAVGGKAASDGRAATSDGVAEATAAEDVTAAEAGGADGEGGEDVRPATDPQGKDDGRLVINNGDEVEYRVTATQTSPDAHANDVRLTGSIDAYAARNGVHVIPDSVRVTLDGVDVTASASVELAGDAAEPSGVTATLPRVGGHGEAVLTYRVSTGKAGNDLLRDRTIKATATARGTNFEAPAPATVDVAIASASVTPTINASTATVPAGGQVSYDAVILNRSEDASSVAKGVYAASAINDYAASIGVAVDPASLQVLRVEGGKVTDITRDVAIKWDGTKGFSVDTGASLKATGLGRDGGRLDMSVDGDARYAGLDHAIVARYAASAADVSRDVTGDNTITDTVITRADNATYAVANKDVTLLGYGSDARDAEGGSLTDASGTISRTGDAMVAAGVWLATSMAAAGAGVAAWLRDRRR